MTKFVPKEVLGDSTFVSVYDPESGDTGYVRLGDLVSKSESTVTATTSPGGGVVLIGPDGVPYDPTAVNEFTHFHGFAALQTPDDPVFYDLAAGNNGVFSENLTKAVAWATPGYVTSGDAALTSIKVPPINYDFVGGETLIVWWLGVVGGPGTTILGTGGLTTSAPGWRLGISGGKVRAAVSGTAFVGYSANSDAAVSDSLLHSVGFVLDGTNNKYGLWVDESQNVSMAGTYATFQSSLFSEDCRTAEDIHIGSAGTASTMNARTRALFVARLPAGVAVKSAAHMTSVFKALRALPGGRVLSGAL